MSLHKTDFTVNFGMILILCCILLLAGGCSALQDLARSVQKPNLSVTNVQVTDFSFSEIELVFDVTVDNPNALSVQMLSYDYNLDINERTFVNGKQDKETRIEASGESTFQVPVRLSFSDVYSAVESLAGSDSASYEFMSSFTFDLPGLGRTEVPVSREGDIPLLKIPNVRITHLQVNEVNLNSANLVLSLEFDNPNGLGFNIADFAYTLNINGSRWAEGSALKGISIPENEVAQLDIPIKLNVTQMGVSVYRMLTGSRNVDYDLKGNFSLGADHPLLGNTEFEVSRQGTISLDKGN